MMMMILIMFSVDEADLNAVNRIVGLLDVSMSKSKPRLSCRRRPSTTV